jgi:PadR family transcriptional regulator PadR
MEPRSFFLGDFEHLVLLALLRLGPDAYGTSIRREIEAHTGRSVSVGALYTALDRLERKGYATSSLADPTPERGGRAKRYYALSPLGHKALRRSRDVIQKMWRGLEPKRGQS